MKKLGAVILAAFMCSVMLLNVFAYIENDFLGETKKDYEGWDYDGDFQDILRLDGIKEPEYNDGLILEVNQLIEGEDTGASAKVYILHETALRIFIEVTDSELIDPTQEQQLEEVTGVQSFDCVQIILDTENGGHGINPWGEEDNSYPWNYREDTPFRIYRMDHTGFGYNEWMEDAHKYDKEYRELCDAAMQDLGKAEGGVEFRPYINILWSEEDNAYKYIEGGYSWSSDQNCYVYKGTDTPLDMSSAPDVPRDDNAGKYFTDCDIIGWGEPLTKRMSAADPTDPNSCVAVRKTENGYNVEICAMLTWYNEGHEFGVNVVLTDVYDGGNKKSAYSLNGEADAMDWSKFDYFTLGYSFASPLDDNENLLDEDGRAAYIAAQKGETVDTTENTGADTAEDTATADTAAQTTDAESTDNSGKDGGGMNPVVMGAAAAAVVAAAVVIVIMKRKKTGSSDG